VKDNGWWTNNWRLRSSNQRETETILLGLLKLGSYLKGGKINSLRIESDNAVAIFNINRAASAVTLSKLTERIIEEAEV
jgi:hypothetical protein